MVTRLSSAACASEAERPFRVWAPARWWGSTPVVAGATTLASREGLLPGGGAGWPASTTCSESSERRLTIAGRQLTVISGLLMDGQRGTARPTGPNETGPDETPVLAGTSSKSSERWLTIAGGQLAIATSRTTHDWWGPACPGDRKILGPDETLEGQPVTGSTWERSALHVHVYDSGPEGQSGAPQKLNFFLLVGGLNY